MKSSLDVERIKNSVNIVDIIDSYVKLKKAGKDYQACCPFHSEKTPSFTVSENKQMYHCFGCGASGDVISFLMEYLSIEFLDAVKLIGGEVVNLPLETIKKNMKRANVRLPLNQEPHDIKEMEGFLSTKCEQIQGKYFYDRFQVILTTDIHKNKVSLALIEGKQFPIRHYKKKFLYGSCVVFGDITETNDTYLFEDLFDARDFHNISGSPVVCFFEPHNLMFISSDLKRKNTSMIVIASTQESIYQADSLNLMNCSFQKLENKVDMNNV